MRPAKVGPEAVGDALVTAFRSGGYAGASLKDLAAASGLKSASLYHRFPAGKVDMARAALARAGEAFGPMVIDPLREAGSPRDRLARSAAGARQFYGEGSLACLLGIMALSDAPAPVLADVNAVLVLWSDTLAATLAEAGVPAPEAEAEDRIAAIQGALVLGRAGAGTAAFERAVARLATISDGDSER
jgi:AcrR family transcriptional regulator